MPTFTIDSLCSHLEKHGHSCAVEGETKGIEIRAVNTLEHAGPGELSFLANPKYRDMLAATRASAVLVGLDAPSVGNAVRLRCKDPYGAVAAAVQAIHGQREHARWGISKDARISANVTIGEDLNIAPGAFVDEGAHLGSRVTLYPGVYVGRGARLGNDVVLYPNVVIYDGCVLGDRVVIHAGTVIGEDGLGYAPVGGTWHKIPQVGTVVIEDDVEIGANCAIDRATLGETRIGRGTKFSNLIAVGHGTRIGGDCMVVGLVGMAGSVTIGHHVTIAGQAGLAGHIKIGDNVQIAAQSGVASDVPDNEKVIGAPAVPLSEGRRYLMMLRKLPALRDEIRKLQAEVQELYKQLNRP